MTIIGKSQLNEALRPAKGFWWAGNRVSDVAMNAAAGNWVAYVATVLATKPVLPHTKTGMFEKGAASLDRGESAFIYDTPPNLMAFAKKFGKYSITNAQRQPLDYLVRQIGSPHLVWFIQFGVALDTRTNLAHFAGGRVNTKRYMKLSELPSGTSKTRVIRGFISGSRRRAALTGISSQGMSTAWHPATNFSGKSPSSSSVTTKKPLVSSMQCAWL